MSSPVSLSTTTVRAVEYAKRLRPYAIPTVLAILAIYLFAELADAVLDNDDVAAADDPIAAWFVANRFPGATAAAQLASFLAGVAFLVPATIIATVLLWWKSYRREAVVFASTMVVNSAAVTALKLAFGRDRPDTGNVLGPISDAYAFPSGHTASGAVFYGMMIALTALAIAGRRATGPSKGLIVAATALWLGICLFVAWSRMYLGYHWATDTMGGFLLGVTVLSGARVVWRRIG